MVDTIDGAAIEPTEGTPDELVIAGFSEDTDLVIRSMDLREIEARIVPWGKVADTPIGLETFLPGSFLDVDPKKVVLRLEHQDPPAGRGIRLEERSDGAYMTFRVSKTPRGDEILTLAADGVTPHVSVGYAPGKTLGEVTFQGGRRVTAIRKTALREVSTTWHPYYDTADVLAVRSTAEGVAPMAETQEAPVSGAEAPVVQPIVDMSQITSAFSSFSDKMLERVEKLEERSRQDIVIPVAAKADAHVVSRGRWMQNVLKTLAGERVSDLEMRSMADLITSDNLGVVPEAFSTELIGVIDAARPFLESTSRVPTPDSGMTLNMPVLTTRPTAGVQVNEKDDIVSTTTSITSTGFDAVTIAGGGDLSLQLLRRSSPSFLDLYLRLLAEALSDNAEAEAISALLSSGVTGGTGTIDPEDLTIGEAWTNARAKRQRATNIWLSSDAVEAFINAKASGSNQPLYATLAADITVGNGANGVISGLRPVYVPALDGTGTDVLIGPRTGFAWAEDGAFTLQVDVPSKAGRDVALVVIDWYAPLYPAAFTTYSL